jgi:hypothetical protein
VFSYFSVSSRVKHWQIGHHYLKAYALVSVNHLGNLNTSFAVRFEPFMVQIVTETAFRDKETTTSSETSVCVCQITRHYVPEDAYSYLLHNL